MSLRWRQVLVLVLGWVLTLSSVSLLWSSGDGLDWVTEPFVLIAWAMIASGEVVLVPQASRLLAPVSVSACATQARRS